MRKITSTFSHANFDKKKRNISDWGKPLSLDVTLRENPIKVKSYDELVRSVAQISHYNRKYSLFFRGQSKDYRKDALTTILPSIYRKDNSDRASVKERFELLREKSKCLTELINKRNKKLVGTALLNKYHELQWAILQHYEVCPTPLLDITHSLHVACSFALDNNNSKSGIVYVLGMPHTTESISYSTYEELLNIRLSGFCPPQAQRPFFQEGYLAGPFPFFGIDESKKAAQYDFARRLIVKFEIPKSESFWGDGFSAIPHWKLYQEKDLMREICEGL